MSYLLRKKTAGYDNLVSGSATGRENIVSGSSQPKSTTDYGGGELLYPCDSTGRSTDYGIENLVSGSSSSPTAELFK